MNINLISYTLRGMNIVWKLARYFCQWQYTLSPLYAFLRAFEKLGKATISWSFQSVCPTALNNSAPTGRILIKFDIYIIDDGTNKCFETSAYKQHAG
jgi:hypothetical protein